MNGKLAIVIASSVAAAGCASTRPDLVSPLAPGQTRFEYVGVLDFRKDTLDGYRRMVQPGDLMVSYMRLGRAVKTGQWLLAVLPHGHSLVVLDADDPEGLLEDRFRGVQLVGPTILAMYSYVRVYRLRDAQRLDLERLREFAHYAREHSRKYSFKSWIGLNDRLQPDTLDEVSARYTCSTMVVAAYHYAGLSLDVSEERRRVITPLSIVASRGRWTEFAPPAPSQGAGKPP